MARLVLVARDWLAGSAVLERWRQRLRPRSFRVYYSWLHRFLVYAGMTPEEAVAWAARARKAGDESLILDRIQEFVLTQTRGRFKTKQLAYCSIRSFFMHNRDDAKVFFLSKIDSDVETAGELRNRRGQVHFSP